MNKSERVCAEFTVLNRSGMDVEEIKSRKEMAEFDAMRTVLSLMHDDQPVLIRKTWEVEPVRFGPSAGRRYRLSVVMHREAVLV